MHIAIGSTAAKYHGVDLGRLPKDLDLFSKDPAYKGNDTFWHPKLLEYFGRNDTRIATVSELYTIKVSHSFWALPGWSKHMADQMLLKKAGGRLIEDLYRPLYSIWTEKHGAKRLNLDMSKDEFFTDAVVRVYDHDSIHDSVAYGDEPLYKLILKDGAEVDIDNRKLWELDHDVLVQLFREEVCATALERAMIPSDYKASPGKAYTWALRRTMTSLTKGKSALFMSLHFEEMYKPCDYVKRHLENKNKLIRLEQHANS